MWTMKCLLCPADDGGSWNDLVKLQEHVMRDHGYSRSDLRRNTRRRGGIAGGRDHYLIN